MEISRQEEIIRSIRKKIISALACQYNVWEVLEDCFAITRLENEIYSISSSAAFNQIQRERMKEAYEELERISNKYPNE